MNALKKGWFSEINDLWPGISQSLQVEKLLYIGQSLYQHILVLQTKSYGKALVLDGIIQCTERDEFSYQEMISFLPLCSHQNPKTILIVGGGDGGVVREVAKFPSVEKIFQIEIDEKVIEVSKAFLPFMAQGFTSSKLNLFIGDGYDFIKQHTNEFDVIITDSSDPIVRTSFRARKAPSSASLLKSRKVGQLGDKLTVHKLKLMPRRFLRPWKYGLLGPAISLYQEPYFTLMRNALKPGGIICSQAGTIWSNLEQVKLTIHHCKAAFPKVGYGISSVPTYPTGQIGYILGSLNPKTNFQEPIKVFTEDELNKMGLLYYSDKIHKSCFDLPRFAEKELNI